ncbi:hypothetical protein [uncultured Novosphingobium sp.]|uniref:hypothetical protein n=1 Tax=uncultured Novosphingobium sp. TaxID=292277 RepID=UPI00258EB5C7|nr:hypothetical protein [uncultured Novosphingobium sp.]
MDITVAEADAYHTLRGNEDWQFLGTDAEKLAALYRASDYIRRYKFIDTDETEALKREAIIRLASEIDTLSEKRAAAGIKTKKESLDGVVSEETTYFDAVSASDPFPDITALLASVTRSESNGKGISVIKLVR